MVYDPEPYAERRIHNGDPEMIALILIIAALVCFVLATFGIGARWNLVAAGLALLTFAVWLLPHLG